MIQTGIMTDLTLISMRNFREGTFEKTRITKNSSEGTIATETTTALKMKNTIKITEETIETEKFAIITGAKERSATIGILGRERKKRKEERGAAKGKEAKKR